MNYTPPDMFAAEEALRSTQMRTTGLRNHHEPTSAGMAHRSRKSGGVMERPLSTLDQPIGLTHGQGGPSHVGAIGGGTALKPHPYTWECSVFSGACTSNPLSEIAAPAQAQLSLNPVVWYRDAKDVVTTDNVKKAGYTAFDYALIAASVYVIAKSGAWWLKSRKLN